MFEKCLFCNHSGKDCIQFVMSLPLQDIITWCKERKEKLGITNAKLSELTNIPKGTIDRMFSESEKLTDFRFSTIQPVVMALTGTAEGEVSCESQVIDEQTQKKLKAQAETIQRLEKELNAAHEQRRTDIQAIRAEEESRVDYMKEQLRLAQITSNGRRKALVIVSTLLGIALLVIIVALIVDKLNTDIGFFWIDRVSSLFSEGANATGQGMAQLL